MTILHYLVDVYSDELEFCDGQLLMAFSESDPHREPDVFLAVVTVPPIPETGTLLTLLLKLPERPVVALAQAQIHATTPLTGGYVELIFGFSQVERRAVYRALGISPLVGEPIPS